MYILSEVFTGDERLGYYLSNIFLSASQRKGKSNMFPTVLCARYRNEENDVVWPGTFSAIHGTEIIFRLTPFNAW